jgi:predicted TIM-barrel fold metal-dependent hydrolase
MGTMEIIDAQAHQPLPRTPWGNDLELSSQAIVAVELLMAAMEAVGVDAAVAYSKAEFCEAAHKRYPDKLVGAISVRHPNDLGDADAFFSGLRLRGLKAIRILRGLADGGDRLALLTEGRWDPALAAAAKHGVPVVFFIPGHLHLVHDIVRRHPDLALIVDHLGMMAPPTVPVSEDILDTLPELIDLAQYENVAVKFTAVPALSLDDYPFTSLWPHLHQVISAFSPQRLMWGSDYTRVMGRYWHPPMPGGRLNYAELLNFLLYTDEVGESDKQWMFSGATRHWLRWPK